MNTLLQLPIFADCPEQELQQWLQQVPLRRERFVKGARIVEQGEACRSVYILTSGTTHMEMGEDGRGLTIDRLHAPEILASAFLFSSEPRFPVSVIAETTCEFWIINKEAFFDFMLQHPPVMRRFVCDISDRSQFLSRKVRSFALKNLRTRVLEWLKERGTMTSVQRAADALGVQRPSLSRILSDLQSEGIVEKVDDEFRLS